MKRRGYSVTPRPSGNWLVQWRDGFGHKHGATAGSKAAAETKGRMEAAFAERVRLGLVTREDEKARAAAAEPIESHVAAWEKDILNRGRTKDYARLESQRVRALLGRTGVSRLVELSAERAGAGLASCAERASPQTANHYRSALRMFCRWCVRTGRLRSSPADSIPKLSAPGKTRTRYAFSDAEFAALVAATATRRDARSFMDGPDRAMWYYTMAHTGFRKREAASLTPESFDLQDINNAYVTVKAAYSKHRREDVQPLRADVARRLLAWLEGKPRDRLLWQLPVEPAQRAQFKRDCKAAGIVAPPKVTLGVHCLRRFYGTSVVREGGLAVGQRLMRHSTPALTAGYCDLTLHDQRKALEGLPGAKDDGEKKRKQA